MQQKRPSDLGAVQDREYGISDCQRLAAVLLGNFNENSQDPLVSVQLRQAFGVGAGGKSGLDADAALSQLFHDRPGGALSEVDRGIVWQLIPSLDRSERAMFIALDPLAGGHANERAGTRAAQSQHSRVHGGRRETLPPVGAARMQV
jgi:hypothetical protein